MTTAQRIAHRVKKLPEAAQREVLDFVEFLRSRTGPDEGQEGDASWRDFSLASAMRGMEDEPTPYTSADLKEAFR